MTALFDLRRIYSHLVCAFVAIGTLFFIAANGPQSFESAIEWGYQTQELFFRYGVFAVVGLSFFLRPFRNTDIKLIALFACLAFLYSLNLGFDLQARRTILNIFIAVIFIKNVADHFNFNHFKIVSFWFLAVLLYNLFACVQQYYKVDPIWTIPQNLGPKDAMVGFMRLKVHLGTLLSIISPVIFFLNPVLALLAIPMLCVANSSAAIGSYVASIGLLFLMKMKKTWAIVAVICLILAGGLYVYKYDLPGGQFGERFKVWNVIYGTGMKTNPFFGSGAGSFSKLNLITVQKNGEPQEWIWAHNEYIQAFYEFGVFGLAILFFYLKNALSCFLNYRNDEKLRILFASLIAICGVSFLHFPFHIGRLAIPCLFLIGLYHGRVRELDDES